jgi:hypothetical protein
VTVPGQEAPVHCHRETLEAILILDDTRSETPVIVELAHLEEHECGRRLHVSVRERECDPRQKLAPEVDADDFEPDHTLERGVRNDRSHLADANAVDVYGSAEHLGKTDRTTHERPPRARSSSALVIFDRPRMLRLRASS